MSHYPYSDDTLRDILENTKTIAVIGASVTQSRPSHVIMDFLLQNGFDVFPVNPALAGKEILGKTVYASLPDIPRKVDMVNLFISSDRTGPVIEAALSLPHPPDIIWMQSGIWNDKACQDKSTKDTRFVMDRCIKEEILRLAIPPKKTSGELFPS
jgi:Predicted CoA-binding protein